MSERDSKGCGARGWEPAWGQRGKQRGRSPQVIEDRCGLPLDIRAESGQELHVLLDLGDDGIGGNRRSRLMAPRRTGLWVKGRSLE